MAERAEITVLVVPRDRFSLFPRCLETLYAATDLPMRVVVVSGGTDAATRRYLLDARASRANLELVLRDQVLSQIQARRLAMQTLSPDERYVVMLENDTLVHTGWLAPLVKCVQEQGAAAVMPLVYWHRGLHSAGCRIERKVVGSVEVLDHQILYSGLHRKPIDYPESHCILFDRERVRGLEIFDEVEPFDVDLGLTLRKHGESMFVEPRSVVTYAAPPRWELGDLPATRMRWDRRRWEDANLRFMAKRRVRYLPRRHKQHSYSRQTIKLALAYWIPVRATLELSNLSIGLLHRVMWGHALPTRPVNNSLDEHES
jgi:GT2 family glycosyltransferase